MVWGTAVARAAHDVGLATWFGGALMGAVGLNSATREVDDHTQRIRVANAGWFRWVPVTSVALASHLLGAWALRRRRGAQPVLDGARAVATAVALVATAETGRSGHTVVTAGDVPVATAVTPISDTPDEVAAAMRRLSVAQWAVPAATACIWLVEAAQETASD